MKEQNVPIYTISTNAVLVNVASPTAVVNAVVVLLDDDELRERIGDAGRETVIAKFSAERQAKQYAGLYASILKLERFESRYLDPLRRHRENTSAPAAVEVEVGQNGLARERDLSKLGMYSHNVDMSATLEK